MGLDLFNHGHCLFTAEREGPERDIFHHFNVYATEAAHDNGTEGWIDLGTDDQFRPGLDHFGALDAFDPGIRTASSRLRAVKLSGMGTPRAFTISCASWERRKRRLSSLTFLMISSI